MAGNFVISCSNGSVASTLVCFPHAGGDVSTYIGWLKHLPDDVRIICYQAAGRGGRLRVPPVLTLETLVKTLIPDVIEHIAFPCLFFGHSFGSLLAFEVLREMRRRGLRLPSHMIASGSLAPTDFMRWRERWKHIEDDEALFDQLANLGGIPRELMAYRTDFLPLMPSVRAELGMLQQYTYAPEPALPIGLTILSATDDELAPAVSMNAWRPLFSGDCGDIQLPGNHFKVVADAQLVCAELTTILEMVRRPPNLDATAVRL